MIKLWFTFTLIVISLTPMRSVASHKARSSASTEARSGFESRLPAPWESLQSSREVSVFENHAAHAVHAGLHERITVSVIDLEPTSPGHREFNEQPEAHPREIERARRGLFERFGINGYQIESIQPRRDPPLPFKNLHTLTGRYLDARGETVRFLEWQYLSPKRLIAVTFLINSENLLDRGRAESWLTKIRPIDRADRAPSSESVSLPSDRLSPARGAVNSTLTDDLVASGADPILCSNVPEADRRRPLENTFAGALKHNYQDAKGCVEGGIKNLREMVSGIAQVARAVIRFEFSDQVQDQATASVAALSSEIAKDPKEFANRALTAIYDQLSHSVSDFNNCFSSSAQLRVICDMATGFLDLSVLFKLIIKAPLQVAELAKLQQAYRKALSAQAATETGLLATRALDHTSSFANDVALTGIGNAMSGKVDPELAAALAHSAAGSARAPAEMLKFVGSYGGDPAQLETSVLKAGALSDAEKARLHRDLSNAFARVAAVRKDHPSLGALAKEDQGELIQMIDRLEKKGISKERIESKLESSKSVCPIN